MTERATQRRLAAALAAAALLALGAPLHQHHGVSEASAQTITGHATAADVAHGGAGCPACQTSATRAGAAPPGVASLPFALPALRLDAARTPAAPSTETRLPSPPRGPPSPIA